MNSNIRKNILRVIREGIKPFAAYPKARFNFLTLVVRALEETEISAGEKPNYQRRYYASTVLKRMIKQGLVVASNAGYSLSAKGEAEFLKYELDDYAIKKPKTWDGKYRVIIFDVPENNRGKRKALRDQLMAWGFVRLQQSVWVIPYECQDLIALLKTKFGLTKDVLYMIVDSIENDRWLRQEFSLS